MEILNAATGLFFNRGYAAVGVDDIGELSGTTGPAIYRHFRGKAEILAALFDQAIDGLLSVTGSSRLAPCDELAHRVRAHAHYVVSQHELASVWIREGRHLAVDDRRRLRRRENGYIDQWTRCILAAGLFDEARHAKLAAVTAISALNGVANWPAAQVEDPDAVDYLTAFVLTGLMNQATTHDEAPT